MIDIQKAVRVECVQLDEFGDKFTPKKTIMNNIYPLYYVRYLLLLF